MPYILISVSAAAVAVAALAVYRMRKMKAASPEKTAVLREPGEMEPALKQQISQSLSATLCYETVTGGEESSDAFHKMYEYLRTRYPLMHQRTKHNTVSNNSLLYRWSGTNPALKPILLCAHLDVVPANDDWEHSPFSGDISEGRIYGRGAIDCKHVLIGLMESAERLMEEGFTPERDIFFAFGHDEEVGGASGAGVISKYFQNYKIEFEMVLDEGPFIMPESPWCSNPAAFVGVTEKGYLNVRLTARAPGGHSSVPGVTTAVGVLSEAICRVTAARFPRRITPVMRELFNRTFPCFSPLMQLYYSNLWLFGPLFLRSMGADPIKNSYLCTTAAPTVINGGKAHNVLPEQAETIINFRPLHGDTCSDIVAFIRSILRGLDVEIEVLRANDPSEVSDYHSDAFGILEKSLCDTYGDIMVSPVICSAATDARKYELVCNRVFRICPFPLTQEELTAMHGRNESIGEDSLAAGVEFYTNFIKNAGIEQR